MNTLRIDMLPKLHPLFRRPAKILVSLLAATLTTGAAASTAEEPAILFQDDFDATSPGAVPSIPPWTDANSASHPEHHSLVRRDLDNLFGKGTDNHFLEMIDPTGTGSSLRLSALNLFSAEVVTLSFLVYEPFEPDLGGQLTVQLFAGDGGVSTANRVQVFPLNSGNIGSAATYGLDAPRRLDLVLNNSETPISYAGGHSLAPARADIWIDGDLHAAGYTASRGSSGDGPIRSIDFRIFSNHNQRIFLDDIVLFEGARVSSPPEAPSPTEAEFPLQLEPGKTVYDLFGYNPQYTQNVPSFDSLNRPYLRSRTIDYDHTSFVHTWQKSSWEKRDFLAAIQEAYPNFHRVYRGAGWIGARVVFDSEDRAYTIVNIQLTPSGHRNLLLFSEDYGESWEVHELSRGGTVAMEHIAGHNELDGPPFLLVSRRRAADHPDPWASYREFYFIQPRIENGQLIVPSYTENHINNNLISLAQHSGAASFSATRDGKTHFVWIEVTDEDVPGTPTFAATYDHATWTMSDPVLIAYAPPKNNSHNRPGIVMDSEGYLHVVTGSHHGQNFYYTRSLEPHDVYAGWTEPEAVWGSGWTAVNGEDRGGQTYVGLVCDPDDTLHLVFRHWRDPDQYFSRPGYSYYSALAYQRKPKNGEWSEPRVLATPERGQYSVWYHNLALDRIGRLFLSFSYFDWELDEQAEGNERYWHRMVVLSDDGGDTWRLADNSDFNETWHRTPYNDWRFRNFSAPEIREGHLTGDRDAPADDNVPNLVKFLLDLPVWTNARSALPAPFLDEGRLAIDFSVQEDVGEVEYRVEASHDLVEWGDHAAGIEIIERFRADGRIHLRARLADPETGGKQKFLRLRTSRPE